MDMVINWLAMAVGQFIYWTGPAACPAARTVIQDHSTHRLVTLDDAKIMVTHSDDLAQLRLLMVIVTDA